METIRSVWSRSKAFRILLILTLIWFGIRLIFQLVYAAGMFPEITGESGLPADLPVYLGAAEHFQLKQPIYPQDLSDPTSQYPYSPPFAFASELALLLPSRAVAVIGTLLNIAAYVLMYFTWVKILKRLNQKKIIEQMAWILPVWLVFSGFWGDVAYLNAGVFVALAATLLIFSILEERLALAILWLTLLLISKFMWIFPIGLPLLLGKRKFFLKLVGFGAVAYLGVVGLSMVAGGPTYVIQQYGAYFDQLVRMGNEFPWHVLSQTPYFGYNHSIKQTLIFFLGTSSWVFVLATILKLGLLAPLALVSVRLLRQPLRLSDPETYGSHVLELIFGLYLAAFIWLDIVWEALLAVVILAYLLVFVKNRLSRGALWVIFLAYALVDVIQLLSYMAGGDSVIQMEGEYVLTDPSLYIPLIMIVILFSYYFIVKRLIEATGKPTLVQS